MFRKLSLILFVSLLLLLTGLSLAALAEPLPPQAPSNTLALAPTVTYTTLITVNTTIDTPSDTQTRTCFYDGGSYFATDDGQCNLRRALAEASHRPPADRPILITFNIPQTDTNYARNGVTGTWTIVMEDAYWEGGLVPNNLTEPNGFVTIDGATQPNGRDNGPKIIINSGHSLEVRSENNIIRNLAFNGGGGIFLNESSNVGGSNLVENNWVGLRDDGQTVDIQSNISLAGTGIFIQSSNNVISGNVATGANAGGVNLQGDNNLIQYNYIGTRGDGSVPQVAENIKCVANSSPIGGQWYGGEGIKFLSGSNNRVLSNTIAGLHSIHSPTESSPVGITLSGSGHEVYFNTLGIDALGNEVGLCGQGIDVSGSNSKIMTNTIYGTGSSFFVGDDPTLGAIFINDSSPLFGSITVRNNLVRNSTETVIEFGPAIPNSLALFEPGQIVDIEGTTVYGLSGNNSPCPNCLIEVYLDDLSYGQDALQLLERVVADASGNFTATLPAPLGENEGLRVINTAQDFGVIPGFDAGTTTRMSPAYTEDDDSISLTLAPGWNLISFDVQPASTAITAVLASLSGMYDVVLGYDNSVPDSPALTYDPNNPQASDLLELNPMQGYWLRLTATSTQTLTISGEAIRDDSPMTLYVGWNLISYLPDRSFTITEALESIAGDYEVVRAFKNGSAQTYIPGQGDFNDLSQFEPGYGYWIKIKELAGNVDFYWPGFDAGPTTPAAPASLNTLKQAVSGGTATDFFTATTKWADFYGVAALGGRSVPSNATIRAYDPDGTLAGLYQLDEPGLYGFLHVYGDDPLTPADEGAEPGDELTFFIDNRQVDTSQNPIVWQDKLVAEENLVIDLFETSDVWADFWGTVTLNGEPAPAGTWVQAYEGTQLIGEFYMTRPGEFGFLHTYGDDPSTTSVDEGATNGDTLSFRAVLPDQSSLDLSVLSGDSTWQGQGSRSELALSASNASPPTIYLPLVLK